MIVLKRSLPTEVNRDSAAVVYTVPLYCGCTCIRMNHASQVVLISGWFIATICLFMNEVILMKYWSVFIFYCDEFSNLSTEIYWISHSIILQVNCLCVKPNDMFPRKEHFPVIYSTHHSERIRNFTIVADRGPPYKSYFLFCFQYSLGIKVYICRLSLEDLLWTCRRWLGNFVIFETIVVKSSTIVFPTYNGYRNWHSS